MAIPWALLVDALSHMTRLHTYRKHVVKATFVVGFLTHLSSVYVSHSVTEIEQCCIFIRVPFTYCVLSIFYCFNKVHGCVVNLVGHA